MFLEYIAVDRVHNHAEPALFQFIICDNRWYHSWYYVLATSRSDMDAKSNELGSKSPDEHSLRSVLIHEYWVHRSNLRSVSCEFRTLKWHHRAGKSNENDV